ncbi:putative nitroreductase family, partial [Tribonema minus]
QARHAAKRFLPDAVPEDIINDVLAMTIRTPTSFNAQPWACIIVRDEEQKEALAQAMVGPNIMKVRAAPLTAVFLADLQPTRRVPRMMEEERRAGTPEERVARLPAMIGLFGGEGAAAEALRRGVTAALSPLKPMPSVTSTEAWSYKHAGLAAQTYLLAATAHGLATAPMEGFDGRRVCAALDVPDRYGVAVAVATGYEDPQHAPSAASWRFAPEEMVFLDRFGAPVPDVPTSL